MYYYHDIMESLWTSCAACAAYAACAVCILHDSASRCQVERMRRDDIGFFLEKECLAGESEANPLAAN